MVFDFTGNNPCVDGDCTTANDWYESRLAEPDVLLEDLVNIITPEAHPVRGISSKASSYALPARFSDVLVFFVLGQTCLRSCAAVGLIAFGRRMLFDFTACPCCIALVDT